MNWIHYATALPALLLIGLAGWGYSLWRRSVNIVDTLWGLFFFASSIVYLGATSLLTSPRATIVVICVALWSFRLAAHLAWRNHGLPEDRRYQKIRASNEPFWIKSLYIVFGLQALLAWIISLPLFCAIESKAEPGPLDLVAGVLWLFGFGWEAISDWQLARFKSDSRNKGLVMNHGLWHYSRHPNYFGECCLWWGYYLFACAGGAWWSLPAPAIMTFLLLRVSGVTMLEADIGNRRPEYALYIRTTSSFIPWFPRADTAFAK